MTVPRLAKVAQVEAWQRQIVEGKWVQGRGGGRVSTKEKRGGVEGGDQRMERPKGEKAEREKRDRSIVGRVRKPKASHASAPGRELLRFLHAKN